MARRFGRTYKSDDEINRLAPYLGKNEMTHTYVFLEVSKSAYDEIKAKLEKADYQHAFHEEEEGVVIDMHGIALVKKELRK